MVSWFDRLLSVYDLHSVRQMLPCSTYALALQRVDVLHSVSTEAHAFHSGGFSGKISRFRVGHLRICFTRVIGNCTLQLRTTDKHVFRLRALPSGIAVDRRQSGTVLEHTAQIRNFLHIEVR